MKKELKNTVVEELHQKLDGATALYLTDFSGMNVAQITEFRNRLRKEGVEYVVVKNTLAQRAISTLDLPDIAAFFTGPTGLVIGRTDAVAAARVLTDFAREFNDKPFVKVGVVDKKSFEAADVKRLASMPPREVLLAQIAGGLQAPMSRLAGGMSQILAGFARAVDGLRQQREAAGS